MLYILLIIPFLSGCVSDDCSECADMAYDTRVKLQVTWPNSLSPTKSDESPELDINDFTLFVLNDDFTVNTIKKVTNPTFTPSPPYTSSVSMNISSNAKYIYAIANCSDLLSSGTLTSHIAREVKNNPTILKSLFDGSLSVRQDSILENSCLIHTGYTGTITQDGTNPYNYIASIDLKPIVSKLDIKVSNTAAPDDYNGCIESVEAFVLNSHQRAKLFSPITTSSYIHGAYEVFWNTYGDLSFGFENLNNQSNTLIGNITLNATTPLSIYVPENDISPSLGSEHKTLVVLKVKYKMKSIENTDEVFYRFLTVALDPPSGSSLSNKRGTKYTITFNLSGKYFGAMSPLSSMMQPYSPTPYKTTKDLIYVAPEDYSEIKVSEWK